MHISPHTLYSNPRKHFVGPVPANSQVSTYTQVAGQFRISRLAQTPVMQAMRYDPVDRGHLMGPYDVSLSRVLQNTYSAVGAVESGEGLHRGTAFLLAANVAILSRHTLEGQDIRSSGIRMGMVAQYGCAVGQFYPIQSIIEDHPELDYMIVRLQGTPGLRHGYIRLSTSIPDTPLALLHHPLGKDLQVSVHTTVQSAYCSTGCTPFHDTDNGSSGAPYIAPNGTCVALHLGTEQNSFDTYLYRVALPIQTIVAHAPHGLVSQLLSGRFHPNQTLVGPVMAGIVAPVRHPFVDSELSLFRLSGSKQVSRFLETWKNPLRRQEITLDTVERRNSREAAGGVYVFENHVYKIYTSPNGPENAMKNAIIADYYGLPTPTLKTFEAMLGETPQTSTKVYVLQMAKLEGRFFQVSKSIGVLSTAISKHNDWQTCIKIARIFKAAGEAGLTDPQGFIAPDSANPLCFIDLHFGTAPNGQLIDMAKLAVSRARLLGNRIPADLVALG